MYDKNSLDLVWQNQILFHDQQKPTLLCGFCGLRSHLSLVIAQSTWYFQTSYFRHWQFCMFDRTVTSFASRKISQACRKDVTSYKKACLLAKFSYPYYLWGPRTHCKQWFSPFFQSYVNLPLLMIVSHVKLTDPSKETLPNNNIM